MMPFDMVSAEHILEAYFYRIGPRSTQHTASFRSRSGRELALRHGHTMVQLFLESPAPQLRGIRVEHCYKPNESRSSNLPFTQCSRLALGNCVVLVSVEDEEALRRLITWYEQEKSCTESSATSLPHTASATSQESLRGQQPYLTISQWRQSVISETEHLSSIGYYQVAADLFHDYLLAHSNDANMLRRLASLRILQDRQKWAASLVHRADYLERHGLAIDNSATDNRATELSSTPETACSPDLNDDVLSYQQAIAAAHESRRAVFDPLMEDAGRSSNTEVSGTEIADTSEPRTGESGGNATDGLRRETLRLPKRWEGGNQTVSQRGVRVRYKRRRSTLNSDNHPSGNGERDAVPHSLETDVPESFPKRSYSKASESAVCSWETSASKLTPARDIQKAEIGWHTQPASPAPPIPEQYDWLRVLSTEEEEEDDDDDDDDDDVVEGAGLLPQEEEFLPEVEQDSTDVEYDWLDLAPDEEEDEDDLETANEPIYARDLAEVDTKAYQLSDWDKARLMAHAVAFEGGDGSGELTRVLARVFSVSPWSATKRAVERLLERDATASSLELALEIRQIWAEHPEFALCFPRRSFLGEGWQRKEGVRRMLSWPMALQVATAWSAFPDPDEVEAFLVDAYDHWLASERLHLQFPEFRIYLNYRIGGISGALQDWPEWTFESQADWLDPTLKLDEPGERYRYRKALTDWGIRSYDSHGSTLSTIRLVKRSRESTDNNTSSANEIDEGMADELG